MATYTLISSNVLASSAASVTFSAIPATYTDLVVKVSARGDNATLATLYYTYFNGSRVASYSDTLLTGNGATVTSTRDSSAGEIAIPGNDYATNAANTFNNGEIYIPSYIVSQYKPISGFSMAEDNAATIRSSPSYASGVVAGLWQNTSAITSISFIPNTGNFVTGSSFYLYGISNA